MKVLIYSLFLLSVLFCKNSYSNSPESNKRPATDANIFGHIINSETGDHVPFITVSIEGTQIATITDYTGHYFIANLPEGKLVLRVQGMGYETTSVSFKIESKQTLEIDVEINPKSIDLNEIVVTASPVQSGYRYQPDKSYVGEELQRRSDASFGEMLDLEPGIAMRSLGSITARPVIRGLNGDRILVLENGERMGDVSETAADHSISLDPLTASRVEVVRGPASLLYGSSALGGVINIMTTDIPDDWEKGASGVVSGQGASMNNMGAGFGRVTYGMDNLAVTTRGSYRKAGDITTPDGILGGTSMENYEGAVGLGFDTQNIVGGTSFSMADQVFELPESPDDDNERVEIRMQRYALQGRMQREFDGFFDKALLRFNASQMYQQEVEMELEDYFWDEEIAFDFDKKTLSSTFIAQHKPIGIFDRGAAGLSFFTHNMKICGEEAFTPGENRINAALFTFQEVPISGMVRLQAGVRVEYQHTEALPNKTFTVANGKNDALNFAGSVGLNIRPSENLEIGGQFARAHRTPTVTELYADGVHIGAGVYEVGHSDLKSEIGHGGDLFAKYSSKYIDVEIAGFINYYRNFILYQSTGMTDEESGYEIFEYLQDEARMRGGELTIDINPLEKMRINLGMDYVFGHRNGDTKDYLPYIPPLRFKAAMEYDFGSVWLGANAVVVDMQDNVAPNESVTPGYTLLGAQAGYRLDFAGRQVIILKVDNLLDVAYRDHLSRVENRNFPMPGRNISLAYRWYF